jgi:hypothetical protein
MLVLSVIAQCIWLAGATLWSAARAIRAEDARRGVIRGALLLYGLIVVWCLLFSVVIPAVLVTAGADKAAVIASFPEAICVVPVILFAWGPALVVMVSGRAIHRAIRPRPRDIA